MSDVDITERRVPQNGRITVRLDGRNVDLRTATLPTVWGEKIVLRILDTGGIDLDLHKLGFTDDNYARFATSFRKPHGMVLVTGPTGSGKSTTLYATLDRDQHGPRSTSSPSRIRSSTGSAGINQIQVNPKAGLDLRRRAAGDPALGPGRHPDRRDPRPGDRAARHRGRAHRPPRAVDPAHQRRAQRR